MPDAVGWYVATVAAVRPETADARTLVLDVPGWPGHLAGQHVVVRLTAADGYSTQRSYSVASAPAGERLELTVERLAEGEVSPYLAEVVEPGDQLELRGPIGGWFVWRPQQPEPVLLVGGGSGVVPLLAVLRARDAVAAPPPFHLVHSVRSPDTAYYRDELSRRAGAGVTVTRVYTRVVPPRWPRPPGRVTGADLTGVLPASSSPTVYVCGPTGFVEAVSGLLLADGHDGARIRTERFGPSAGAA